MLDWLFPPKCIVCLDILSRSRKDGFCGDCRGVFTELGEQSGEHIGVFVYDGVMSEVIHAFKYGNHPAHGRVLGRLMAERVDKYFEGIDLIVPVPMYRPKERHRGFNQADILAREIARHTKIAYDGKSLRRVRDTAAQSGLSSEERKTNLDGAFKLNAPVTGKNILLIDDIMTTGSTLTECAEELQRGGAAGVRGYTLAATIKKC
ncbi:MAG: ComF family protein [Defluviitaleaceae bacterium]|nr:ComF family protein [Defluviitaleaceae bacterium]